MTRFVTLILVTACVATAIAQAQSAGSPAAEKYWPQFRGPLATGVAPQGHPPTTWDEDRNVRWKVAVPGRGHSSPIIWGDRIYIETAVPLTEPTSAATSEPASSQPTSDAAASAPAENPRYKFMVLALDRRTGRTVWERIVCEAALHERGHPDASPVSNSPATDGQVLVAHFGSRGVYGMTLDGEVLWTKNLGQMQTIRSFGEGSSPALAGDAVIITWDHEGPSFIVALDKRTGAERWRVDRDQQTTWATPLVLPGTEPLQVVAGGPTKTISYEVESGRVVWECAGLTRNVIPTPVADRELLYLTSGFRASALLAIRYHDAHGDLTGTPAVAWTWDGKGTPYVPSPVLCQDALYFLNENQAMLSCVAARTGKTLYEKQRLEGLRDVYSSLVAAGDHVYIVGRNGTTAVVAAGPEFKLAGTNTLDESFAASPAIADGELYLRGQKYLYCIAE
jgi:outer membrane protein assembly factor BamB